MNINRKSYLDNGFILKEDLFSSSANDYKMQISMAIKEMAKSINVDQKAYLQAVNRWNSPCPVVELLTNRSVVKLEPIISHLLNAPVRVVRSSIIQKSGIAKKGTHAHQDSGYWVTNNSKSYDITSWIALDDVDESNGALIVLEKSHLEGSIQQADFLALGFIDPSTHWDQNAKTLTMKAGDVALFSPDLWHASHPCSMNKERNALIIRWQAIPCQYKINQKNFVDMTSNNFGLKNSSNLLYQKLRQILISSKIPLPESDNDLVDLIIKHELINVFPNPALAKKSLENFKILSMAQKHYANDLGNSTWENIRDYVIEPNI